MAAARPRIYFRVAGADRGAARLRAGRQGAAPELCAAQAQKGVVADRTPVPDRTREVSHSLVATQTRTVGARPSVVVDRSREVDSREVRHNQAATHRRGAAARSRVVADGTRGIGYVRVAPCKRTAVAHSRVAAVRIEGVGHSRVAADRRTAAAHNRDRVAAARTHRAGHGGWRPKSVRRWHVTGRQRGQALGFSMIKRCPRGEQHCRGRGRNAKATHHILCSASLAKLNAAIGRVFQPPR